MEIKKIFKKHNMTPADFNAVKDDMYIFTCRACGHFNQESYIRYLSDELENRGFTDTEIESIINSL